MNERQVSAMEFADAAHAGRVKAASDTSRRLAAAIRDFFSTPEAATFLDNVEQADEVLAGEESRDGRDYRGKPNPSLYVLKEERELAIALVLARQEADKAMETDDFQQALHAIAALGPLLAAFLRNARVDAHAPGELRENRLKLLNEIREGTRAVGAAA
ncbi:glycyl-tRNA synthetase subunit beta [Variibacter gotjawalensis]|uniref:Glycyl-tRNA synthetase subunit beta n=1 Tax=Variibacter gotjawalensis TaxID=1333996 RepID=A0A0S3PT08_9BRAD|nr:hypothetical protein [Variibacter gotjawalensis]NIK49379.1 glycyl-tRNA synthetase beta subunit [Variibacter gotjawalensis]RZS51231.1 hypothetical protein EV661_3708 [Variibacter gotjawalensis]BAT59064.1 glycyl-tRNA synthetase subunit beta [Variibacter gotjawalensis]